MMIEAKNNAKSENQINNDSHNDFVGPDGGYGWIIAIACGFSLLTVYPCFQYFGIVYQDRLLVVGMSNFETTIIYNFHLSMASLSGLVNGPLYKRFSIRQVAFGGSFLIALSLLISSFANSFPIFLVSYSLLYGFGRGICVSSTIIITNNYFKMQRLKATGYAWTISAIGQMLIPYIANALHAEYGYQGTVWIFSGIALNSCICAMLYKPVQFSIKKQSVTKPMEMNSTEKQVNIYCHCQNSYYNQAFVLVAKDNSINDRALSSDNQAKNDKISIQSHIFPGNLKKENKRFQRRHSKFNFTSCSNENEVIYSCTQKNLPKNKIRNKIIQLFDLDLLKDPVFVMLILGITLSYFSELNFTGLIPFILMDFGYSKSDTALLLVLIGIADVIFKFLIPFILQYLKWSMQFLFIVSILIVVTGRAIFSVNPSFYVMLGTSFVMGIGRALHIILILQIIPMYVAINKIPAATGLQFLFCGIFTTIFGPFLGKLTDLTNFTVTINVLNLISMVTGITWSIHLIYNKCKNKNKDLT